MTSVFVEVTTDVRQILDDIEADVLTLLSTPDAIRLLRSSDGLKDLPESDLRLTSELAEMPGAEQGTKGRRHGARRGSRGDFCTWLGDSAGDRGNH